MFTISTVLGQLMRPKVAPPKPASFSEFYFPTADANRCMPRPYGTVIMKAPNVTSVTDFSSEPIVRKLGLIEKLSLLLTMTGKQTIGFRYYCGIEMGLGYRVDRYTQINIGDKVAWTGSVTTDTEIFINQPSLFGGDDQASGGNGGIVGYLGVHVGLPNASKDSYLVSEYGNYSAHRDRSYVVFKGQHRAKGSGYLGNSTTVQAWSFITETLPANIPGAGAYKNINSGDANPAEVIYDIMRNALYGAGMDGILIDDASFLSCAQTYFNDGFGFSGLWDTSKPCSDVINGLLTLTDSILYSDLRTGLCVLKAARADYDVDTIPVFDQNNILSMAGYSRSAWNDTTNWLTVPFVDRTDSFAGKNGIAYDLANVETQSGVVPSNVQHIGISNGTTAAKIAQRDLRALSTPLAKHTIQVNRTGYKMTPGAVYKWNWPDIVDDQGNGIVDMVMRATSVKYGDTDQPIIEIEGIEDVFNSTANVIAAAPASGQAAITTPAANSATTQLAELPYMLSGEGNAHLWTMAIRPAGNYSYDLYDSPDNSEFTTDQTNNSFTPTGVLNASYAQNTSAVDNSGTFAVTGSGSTDLDKLVNSTATQVGNGANLMLVVQSTVFEIMAFETISIVSGNYQFNNVWRGLMDTTPQAFTAGARVWFFSYGDARGAFPFVAGATAYAKLLSRSLQGTLDAGSATLLSRTINQRALRPYSPGNVTINASATTTTIPSTGDITIAWAHRDRTRQGTIIPQSNTSIAGPEGGANYILKIYNQAGTLLRTVTGLITTSYVYTNVNETADNGGLANALTFVLYATRDGLTSYHAQIRGVSRTGASPSNPAYSPSGTYAQPATGNATAIAGVPVTGAPDATHTTPVYDPASGTITWQLTGLTVTEPDGSPILAATTLRFPNGSVTNIGGGIVDVSATGPAGTPGTVWYSGTTAPSGGTGIDGDYYLRTTTGDVYKKVSGSWGSPIENITGPTGATGSTGTPGTVWFSGAGAPSGGTGVNGDYYLNTTNGDVYKKVSGSWGSPIENLTGPTGAAGTTFLCVDSPQSSPPTETDEFNSVSLDAKWTVSTNTVAAVLHNTTFKSILAIKFTGNQQYTMSEPCTSSGDFSITVKFHIAPNTNSEGAQFYISDSTIANALICVLAFSSGVVKIQTSAFQASSFSVLTSATLTSGMVTQVYLHAQRESGVYRTFYSFDGVSWFPHNTGFTPSPALTVSKLIVEFGRFGATTKQMMGIDFIRRDWFMHP